MDRPEFSQEWQDEQLRLQEEDSPLGLVAVLLSAVKGGVTAALSPRERKIAKFYKKEGFQRPYLMAAAVKNALEGKVENPWATGAALVSMETGNGRMIFGCDWGPGVAFCHEPVTRAKVDWILRNNKANGVGATQLTFIPFVREADTAGGAHRYYPNVLTGYRILARNIKANGLQLGFTRYNGSGPAAEAYGRRAMAKRTEYIGKLDRWLADKVSPKEKRIRQVQEDLLALGFAQVGKVDGKAGPATRDAVREFKRMCVRTRFKKVDGSIGTKTAEVIHKHRTIYKGTVTRHFTFKEFASTTRPGGCKGNGHIRGNRELIAGLEKVRQKINRPITILNGHRDPGKNKCVGGASQSQHLYGNAADTPNLNLTVNEVKAFGAFSGIGYSQASGKVLHVDVRHTDPKHNFTGGTTARPTVWRYA